MKKVAIVCKYLPYYRLAVFNQLSKMETPTYEIIADTIGKEGIKTISFDFSELDPDKGGITWVDSKSYYYKKSLQYWQTNVVKKIFSKQYSLFILDGAASHLTTWIFSILCRLAGKKILFWTHGFKGTDRGLNRAIRTLFFKYLPHGLILYGDFSKEMMAQNGFNTDKIFVIGNSLDYNKQSQLRIKFTSDKTLLQAYKNSILKDFKTLVFIGRLVPNKKIELIIDLLYDLKQEGLNLNCIIIGGGAMKDQLAQTISHYNLTTRFHFAGELYQEEQIAQLLLISDLMLSPGNVGLNCIHALTYGVPVITHDNFSYQNPEVEAIKDGKNGLLFRYNDYGDMKEKVRHWFSTDHPDILTHCLAPIEQKFNPRKHAELINYAVSQFSPLAEIQHSWKLQEKK